MSKSPKKSEEMIKLSSLSNFRNVEEEIKKTFNQVKIIPKAGLEINKKINVNSKDYGLLPQILKKQHKLAIANSKEQKILLQLSSGEFDIDAIMTKINEIQDYDFYLNAAYTVFKVDEDKFNQRLADEFLGLLSQYSVEQVLGYDDELETEVIGRITLWNKLWIDIGNPKKFSPQELKNITRNILSLYEETIQEGHPLTYPSEYVLKNVLNLDEHAAIWEYALEIQDAKLLYDIFNFYSDKKLPFNSNQLMKAFCIIGCEKFPDARILKILWSKLSDLEKKDAWFMALKDYDPSNDTMEMYRKRGSLMYKILSYYKDQEIEKNPINWINTMHDIKYSLVIRHLSMINPNLDIRIVEYVISKTDSDFHSRLKESVKNFYFAGEMQNIIDSKLPAKNLSMLTVTTSLSESCSTQSK